MISQPPRIVSLDPSISPQSTNAKVRVLDLILDPVGHSNRSTLYQTAHPGRALIQTDNNEGPAGSSGLGLKKGRQ